MNGDDEFLPADSYIGLDDPLLERLKIFHPEGGWRDPFPKKEVKNAVVLQEQILETNQSQDSPPG